MRRLGSHRYGRMGAETAKQTTKSEHTSFLSLRLHGTKIMRLKVMCIARFCIVLIILSFHSLQWSSSNIFQYLQDCSCDKSFISIIAADFLLVLSVQLVNCTFNEMHKSWISETDKYKRCLCRWPFNILWQGPCFAAVSGQLEELVVGPEQWGM